MSWVEKPDAKAESSSLQLLSNDQAANGPRNRRCWQRTTIKRQCYRVSGIPTVVTTHRPGLKRILNQVAFNEESEAFYGGPLPEAVSGSGVEKGIAQACPHPAKIWSLPKRIFINLAVGTFVIFVATTLAAGNQSSCWHSNKDRYVFFQDHENEIRHAIRLASSSTWVTGLPLPLAVTNSNRARKHTPLAVHLDSSDRIFVSKHSSRIQNHSLIVILHVHRQMGYRSISQQNKKQSRFLQIARVGARNFGPIFYSVWLLLHLCILQSHPTPDEGSN